MSMVFLCACTGIRLESNATTPIKKTFESKTAARSIAASDTRQTAESLKRQARKTVAASASHTLAIRDDGSLWSWGYNKYGQLGDGTTENRSSPVKIMDSVVSVSVSDGCSMAIKEDGSLWTWGSNWLGQLGDGTTENRYLPAKVMDSVSSVYCSWINVFAIRFDGSLWVWGVGYKTDDNNVSAGNGQVKIMDNVKTIVEGDIPAAITQDGSLWVWGYRYGALFFPPEFLTPEEAQADPLYSFYHTPIKIMESVAAASMNTSHTVVVKQDGSLWEWEGGMWDWDEANDCYHLRKPVYIMDSVRMASLGKAAVKTDGSFWIWGNRPGEYPGSSVYKSPPEKIMDSVAVMSANPTMVIKEDGSLWTWSGSKFSQPTPDKEKNEQLSMEKVMDCVAAVEGSDLSRRVYVIKQDGTLWTWGDNKYGELGDGTTEAASAPVKIIDHVRIPDNAVPPRPSVWAAAEVNSLEKRGVIPGALKNSYQAPIRRDEFTALMVNVFESATGKVAEYKSPFTDIADSNYKDAVGKAYTIGLVDGTSATTFTPGGLLTREQAAKILCNLVSTIKGVDISPKSLPGFIDSASISSWALKYVAFAQENKIMLGDSSGRFNPRNNLTREEAMLVTERLFVRYNW